MDWSSQERIRLGRIDPTITMITMFYRCDDGLEHLQLDTRSGGGNIIHLQEPTYKGGKNNGITYLHTHTHTELISSMDWSVTTHRLTGLSTNTSTERYKKLRTAKVFYTWSIETVNKSPCIILPCPSKSIATLTPHDCKCWELQWFRWIWKHAKNCQLLCLCLFNPPPFFPR